MTQEEIDAIRKRRNAENRKERDRRWHQSEKYKEYQKKRSKMQWQKYKERMHNDPEFREKENAKRRIYPDHTVRGKLSTMTDSQKDTIARLYGLHYKVTTIAREVNEPYPKVYQYILHHIKNQKTA